MPTVKISRTVISSQPTLCGVMTARCDWLTLDWLSREEDLKWKPVPEPPTLWLPKLSKANRTAKRVTSGVWGVFYICWCVGNYLLWGLQLCRFIQRFWLLTIKNPVPAQSNALIWSKRCCKWRWKTGSQPVSVSTTLGSVSMITSKETKVFRCPQRFSKP